jgi:hypothetical protein
LAQLTPPLPDGILGHSLRPGTYYKIKIALDASISISKSGVGAHGDPCTDTVTDAGTDTDADTGTDSDAGTGTDTDADTGTDTHGT